MLDLRSPDSTGHLFLLFSFQFSFFLWSKLGLFLMFPLSFIFFSLITHIYFSLLENYLRRTVRYLSGCYQYYRSKSILLLKLYESSNVISIESLNQNDRNKMNNIYQPEKRKPRLFDLVSQEIQTLHYSRWTEKTYIGWIKRFILFHGKRHPAIAA